jgi:hypothetical protein
MAPTKEREEPKQTLPPGHPQAGYTSEDLSGEYGTGTLPEAEQEWHDDLAEAQEKEAEAAAEHEDEVAKAEAKEAEEKAAKAKSAEEKEAPKTKTPAAKDSS